MKKFLAALFLAATLVLSGCFGGDDEETPIDIANEEQVQTVEAQGVSLQIPVSWSVLERSQYPDKLPPNIILLASSGKPWGQGQIFATIAIATEALPANTAHEKYKEAAVQNTKQEIINYQNIAEENINLNGTAAKLLRFTGKNSPAEETLEWQHLFFAHEGTGYVVSSTAPPDTSEQQKQLLQDMVVSFAFADQDTSA